MLSRVHSYILIGIDAILCEVEVDVSQHGLEKTTVVGLAQAAVKEIDRAGAAGDPQQRLPVPGPHAADQPRARGREEGGDRRWTCRWRSGMLRATNSIKGEAHKDFLIAGELALDGRVRKIKGGLSLALLAKEKEFRGVILPRGERARGGGGRGDRGLPGRHAVAGGVVPERDSCRWSRTSWTGQPYQASQGVGRRWTSPTCAGRRRSSGRSPSPAREHIIC